MAYKILLVDDDRENLVVTKKLLSAAGYQVHTAESGQDAVEMVRKSRTDFALALVDFHMPGLSGAETVAAIKEMRPTQQMLAFSMDDTREVMRATFKAGVVDFIDKNIENDALLSTISNYCIKYEQLYRTIDNSSLRSSEKQGLIHELGMIGRSPQLYELVRQIKVVSPTSATTLILGDSGTGKELVARAMHRCSERSQSPFVAINIAAEPSTLLDSTLFGHRRGAFTGAVADQPGKFRLAEKGTIFLDEIGDMSLDMQVKLLRVLQEREICPIGATRPIPIDVRIIAATHRNLEKMIAKGTFREDLYYRLSTIILTTTPLRERPEDIEPLVAYFTDEICRENGFRRSFNHRCLDVLQKHSWKGNIRELRSVVERHLVQSEKDVVRVEDLEPGFFEAVQESGLKTMEDIDQHVDGVKQKLVENTLKRAGSKVEAARILKVTQPRLHYFLSKWRLSGNQKSSSRIP